MVLDTEVRSDLLKNLNDKINLSDKMVFESGPNPTRAGVFLSPPGLFRDLCFGSLSKICFENVIECHFCH